MEHVKIKEMGFLPRDCALVLSKSSWKLRWRHSWIQSRCLSSCDVYVTSYTRILGRSEQNHGPVPKWGVLQLPAQDPFAVKLEAAPLSNTGKRILTKRAAPYLRDYQRNVYTTSERRSRSYEYVRSKAIPPPCHHVSAKHMRGHSMNDVVSKDRSLWDISSNRGEIHEAGTLGLSAMRSGCCSTRRLGGLPVRPVLIPKEYRFRMG